jgi:cytochrome c oxidase cbb3-type subunit I/II
MFLINMFRTMAKGSLLAYEEDSAPPLPKKLVAHSESPYDWHRWIEGRPAKFTIAALVAILIGSAVEMVPSFLIKSNVPTISSVKPYTPLELEGRDIYVAEGCNTCHSQLIRPFRSETERYGEYSKAGEFVYDHPFLWGSKRTGPDLQRVGGKYPDAWHYNHMIDPTTMSPGSIMPPFPWLAEQTYDINEIPTKIRAMQTLGVPYPDGFDQQAPDDARKQAAQIVATLKESDITIAPDKKLVALIAYLQRLGKDIKNNPTAQANR